MRKPRNIARRLIGLTLPLAGLIIGATQVPGLASAQVAGPSWNYTGNLNIARYWHTATLLPSGKVLVAGGNIYDVISAELYDPATGAWSVTGNPNTARAQHTATLLPNGKVLVVGGWSYSSGASWLTAELYDPATGIWSITGNLNGRHVAHTATLLPNGKVLVAGDWGDAVSSSAELYDPVTGKWSITGSLNTAHAYHTATLLPNGKVLVVGGNSGFAASTELYDPATENWSMAGSLSSIHSNHTATLLQNGKILIAGGNCQGQCYGASAELYDPATGTWSVTGPLHQSREDHSATLLPNGKVLVAGGGDGNWEGFCTEYASAELYDPATGIWSNAATLNTGRELHTATLLSNGKVLVSGNCFTNGHTAELYDSGTSSFANPIDDAQFFVRQHYLDFLNREPDAAGLAFWTNEITSCGADPSCIEVKHINVSAAFFLSIEFQQTGYLAYRGYMAAFGNIAGKPVPIARAEMLSDTQQIGNGVIVGLGDWEQRLEQNKRAYFDELVTRQRFTILYPQTMTAAGFVDALNQNAGGILSQAERDAVVADLSNNMKTRAQVLRAVAEDSDLQQSEFNRAFVLMQYFGYLRRNPNDAPDADFAGYNFWLNKLNSFNGDYVQAEMVTAFISSTEYRQRFGQ